MIIPLIPRDISREDLDELIDIINKHIKVCSNFTTIDENENKRLGLTGDYGFHIDTRQFEKLQLESIMEFAQRISKPHSNKLF